MNDLQVFNNPDFGQIRVLGTPENPLFCLSDICKTLELPQVAKVVQRLEDEVLSMHPMPDSLGRLQETYFVNEDGLYDVVLDSRKPEAKRFRKWITSEVLPTIRKTGSYSIKQPSQLKGDEVKLIGEIAEDIQSLFAVKRGIAISQAIDVVSEERNLKSLNKLKKLLPPADYETGYMNATQLGEKLGGVPAQTVNRMLAKANLQYKDGRHWRITEYGEEMPYTKNGHSGYPLRWNEKIIPLFIN